MRVPSGRDSPAFFGIMEDQFIDGVGGFGDGIAIIRLRPKRRQP